MLVHMEYNRIETVLENKGIILEEGKKRGCWEGTMGVLKTQYVQVRKYF